MFCPHCGEKLSDTARFCPSCGERTSLAASGGSTASGAPHQQAAAPKTSAPASGPAPTKSKTPLIIAAVAVVVVAIAAGAFLLLRSPEPEESLNVEAGTEELSDNQPTGESGPAEEKKDEEEKPLDETTASSSDTAWQVELDDNPASTAAYAVCIYGIEQDTDSSGKTMGLTFGPALGADYTNSSVSHEVDSKGEISGTDAGKTQSGNAYRCIHCDNWKTIISWNKKDPYVYEKCLTKGCTHKLQLDFSQSTLTSFQNNFKFTGTGDGPSVLVNELLNGDASEIEDDYAWYIYESSGGYENLAWSSGEYYDTGWAGSRVRAMLNGAQSETDTTSTAPDYYVSDPASIYTSSNCLLAAFPKELQEAIGERKTAYGALYNTDTASYVYDKLFLFSVSELTADSTLGGYDHASCYYQSYDSLSSNGVSPTPYYTKFAIGGLSYYNNSATQAYRINDPSGGSSSSSGSWWLRSAITYSAWISVYRDGTLDGGPYDCESDAAYVGYAGEVTYLNVYYTGGGVAPGFSLSR